VKSRSNKKMESSPYQVERDEWKKYKAGGLIKWYATQPACGTNYNSNRSNYTTTHKISIK